MDLANINIEKLAEQGAILELEHPVSGDVLMQDKPNEKKPVTINVLGTDSKVWRNKQREYQRKRIASMQRNRKNADLTISDEDACELLAECTTGWDGIVISGKPVEFSKDAAYDLYMKFNWIREQVDAFMGDRANFLKSA